MPYSLTEPHPTTRPNHYTHTGRGGAGNMYKPTSSTISTSTPLRQTVSHASSSGKFSSGRGGAGNIRPVQEAAPFSFDEELSLQTTREQNHDVWHVGRVGAGNWTRKGGEEDEGLRRKETGGSESSQGSARSGWLGRLSGAFERR
jgi:hypothetical protein